MDTRNQARSLSPESIQPDGGPQSPNQIEARFQLDKAFKTKSPEAMTDKDATDDFVKVKGKGIST
jgi:hypothetical protein